MSYNRGRHLQPQLLPKTREVAIEIMQVNLSSDRLNDYWTVANHNSFNFSKVWNEIRQHTPTDNNYSLVWHNMTARKFSFTAYLAYIEHLPILDRLANWGMNVDLQYMLCHKYNESHAHLFTECEFSTYL